MSNCNKSKYAGPELQHCCDVPPGGTPVVRAPVYVLTITNPPPTSDCDMLEEDDGQIVTENDGQILCVDNV